MFTNMETNFIPETPNDKQREAFRRYLERSGVVDAITNSLVMLFALPEKPENPLDFIRKNLGDERPELEEYNAVLKELEDMKSEYGQLKEKYNQLKIRLKKYEMVESESEIIKSSGTGGDTISDY